MKASEVVDRLITRAPQSDSWIVEPYGAYLVDGNAEVSKVLYCVTPTKAVVDHFLENKYDLLVSHHPFVIGVPQVILHTALDCCPGGMNDQWRDAMGIKDAKHFDKNLGWYGDIDPTTFNDLVTKVEAFVGFPLGWRHCDFGEDNFVKSVVICSGLGGLVENQAHATGAECYITGQLTHDPAYSHFSAIIEVGHTISESKPGYNLIKSTLPDLQVDCTPINKDIYGREHYYGE